MWNGALPSAQSEIPVQYSAPKSSGLFRSATSHFNPVAHKEQPLAKEQ